MLKCLENAIGITRSDCVCITSNLPEGYDTSASGVFLDEIRDFPINLAMFKGGTDCQSMADLLIKARDNAYKDFQLDLYKLIQTRFKNRDATFNGTIGSKNFNSNYVTGADYAGLEITALPYRGAVMVIKGIYASFNFTGQIEVQIFKSYAGSNTFFQVGDPFNINAVSGVITMNDIDDIELPLYDSTYSQIKYYLVYSTEGNMISPKNNDLSCGCGSIEADAKKYIEWMGFTSSSADLSTGITRIGRMMGLTPELEIKCGSSTIICEEYQKNDILFDVVNNLLAMKAASNAIRSLLESGIVNKYTMMNAEALGWKASALKKQYQNDVQWFSENMDITNFDCYLCKDSSDSFRMAGIKL